MGPRPAQLGSNYESNQVEESLLFQGIIRD